MLARDPGRGDVHYVRKLQHYPPCGDLAGRVTTSFWEVTCDPCLHSLPLAMDQFRQAYSQLLAALRLSVHSRHSRLSS